MILGDLECRVGSLAHQTSTSLFAASFPASRRLPVEHAFSRVSNRESCGQRDPVRGERVAAAASTQLRKDGADVPGEAGQAGRPAMSVGRDEGERAALLEESECVWLCVLICFDVL